VAEAFAYRAHVDRHMKSLLAGEHGALDGTSRSWSSSGSTTRSSTRALLTDVKHVLALNPLEPAYRSRCSRGRSARETRERSDGWATFDGGLVEIGADGERFAFDNERPRHRSWLEPFELARAPVTAASTSSSCPTAATSARTCGSRTAGTR
jgi:formylglycine-generating enzyme required for sulfatase activity